MSSRSSSSQESDRRHERRERNLRFLQQQIQKDLEEEAALKGESVSATSVDSDRIKETAQEMVQAAQHARTVVRSEQAKKTLIPMTTSQVAALSQKQARELVEYKLKKRQKSLHSYLDLGTLVHIQAQALEHAYKQALVKEGKYLEEKEEASPTMMAIPTFTGGSSLHSRLLQTSSESTPLLARPLHPSPLTDYGNRSIDSKLPGSSLLSPVSGAKSSRPTSWLRKLYAGVLVSVVIILAVHYTNSTSSRSQNFTKHSVNALGQQGSQSYYSDTVLEGTSGEDFSEKYSTQQIEENDTSNYSAPKTIASTIAIDAPIHKGKASKETPSAPVTLLVSSTSPPNKKVDTAPAKLNTKERTETIPPPPSSQQDRSNVMDNIVDSKVAPSMWDRVSSIFVPMATVIPNTTPSSNKIPIDNAAAAAAAETANKMETATTASEIDIQMHDDTTLDTAAGGVETTNKNRENTCLDDNTPPPVVDVALPVGAEEFFASLLLDESGFFFPFVPSSYEKEVDSPKRFLRYERERVLHGHRNRNHHDHDHQRHPEHSKHSSKTASQRLKWSLDSTMDLKDAAAVGEYYHTKGQLLSMSIGDSNLDLSKTPTLPLDWEQDSDRREVLRQTYAAIGDTINEHYQNAFAPPVQGLESNNEVVDGTRRFLAKASTHDGIESLSFTPDYTWQQDWKRGRLLGRLYQRLSDTIEDHYQDESFITPPSALGEPDDDDEEEEKDTDSLLENGRTVSDYYKNKTISIEDFYAGKLPLEDMSTKPSIDTGRMIEDYYKAVYSPTNYKGELLAQLPQRNPDKDFPSWGHNWKDDRDHRIALSRYWKQYHSVMDAIYKENGGALSTKYQDFYQTQFQQNLH
ncbi:hypothetical protein IV203_025384 [Nitzschia inconspicua]|uniref:Uncharacterized protein n=1 Tax=Nitzschia inconspicua TaxID=303405 RepID=A0A9K3PWU0_9STRA|nr:hypothetical protein IV203_024810 [Nitzschia inconspicua]KAG7362500.1 hypothetical protein IV203_025384 [Nitzschia inconspicua]